MAHRGRPASDDELRTVAAIYVEAKADRAPVQAAVAEAFGISPSTAAKRIMAARRAGLLDAVIENRGRTDKARQPQGGK
jgi:transposase